MHRAGAVYLSRHPSIHFCYPAVAHNELWRTGRKNTQDARKISHPLILSSPSGHIEVRRTDDFN